MVLGTRSTGKFEKVPSTNKYSTKAGNVREVGKKFCQVAVDIGETHLIQSDSLNHARPPFSVDSTVQSARVLYNRRRLPLSLHQARGQG